MPAFIDCRRLPVPSTPKIIYRSMPCLIHTLTTHLFSREFEYLVPEPIHLIRCPMTNALFAPCFYTRNLQRLIHIVQITSQSFTIFAHGLVGYQLGMKLLHRCSSARITSDDGEFDFFTIILFFENVSVKRHTFRNCIGCLVCRMTSRIDIETEVTNS